MDANVLGAYAARRNGPGYEILGPSGVVICWTATETVAVQLVALLNLAHEAGLIDEEPDK
jgi:hypothetical protein